MIPFRIRPRALAALLLAGACGCASNSVVATPLPLGAQPSVAWRGQPVSGSPIQHVVVVIQENRTTDNLFASSIIANGGPYPGANVTQVATIGNLSIPMRRTPFEAPGDPSHSHKSLLGEWNRGKMNGFPHDYVSANPGYTPPPNFTLSYVPAPETTVYHLFAQRYALADMNFAPRLVPTFPGHMFLVAATSQPADDPYNANAYLTSWGCDSAPGTTVDVFLKTGEGVRSPGPFPCFDNPVIGDLLDQAKVSWKYYTGAVGNAGDGNGENVYDAIKHIRYGPDWSKVISPSANVLSDIQNCNLPQVSYVTPTWTDSDHAGSLANGGPGWVASIYAALVLSTQSKNSACRYYGNTAMIVTWDDSGGWYDHVKPPPGPNATTFGFRVPIIVISPWARSNYRARGSFVPYVSHTVRETTAILRFIERNWRLGNLGQRDASGDDLRDMFDYARSKPVPPFSGFVVRKAIEQTDFNLEAAAHDAHVVDDDR